MSNNEDVPRSFSLSTQQQLQVHQQRGSYHASHLAFLLVAIFLIGGIWVLNVLGIVPGPWSGIFSGIFAVFGVLLALLPFPPFSKATSAESETSSVVTPNRQNHHLQLEGVMLGVDDSRGALVVYVKKYLRGSTIYLSRGFVSVDLTMDAASSVVGRRVSSLGARLLRAFGLGGRVFVAVFPALEPGRYTVYSASREFVTKVNIYAGLVVEVDWQ